MYIVLHILAHFDPLARQSIRFEQSLPLQAPFGSPIGSPLIYQLSYRGQRGRKRRRDLLKLWCKVFRPWQIQSKPEISGKGLGIKLRGPGNARENNLQLSYGL